MLKHSVRNIKRSSSKLVQWFTYTISSFLSSSSKYAHERYMKEIRFYQFPMWSFPIVFQMLLLGFLNVLKNINFSNFSASQFQRSQNDAFTTRDPIRDVSLRRRNLMLLPHYRRNFCVFITGCVYQLPLNII